MTATTDTPRTNKASALEPAAGHCPKCFQSLASAQMRNQYRKQLATARAEADELRREVREWVCESCNTLYPGPPQPGFKCLQCPKCGGTTMPWTLAQRRALERVVNKSAAEANHLRESVEAAARRMHEAQTERANMEISLVAARRDADELARRCIQKALPVFASTFCTPDDLIARVRTEMEEERTK